MPQLLGQLLLIALVDEGHQSWGIETLGHATPDLLAADLDEPRVDENPELGTDAAIRLTDPTRDLTEADIASLENRVQDLTSERVPTGGDGRREAL